MRTPDTGRVVTAHWLARFRWAVAAGAIATLTIGRGALGVAFPLPAVGALLTAQALSNLWLEARLARGGEAPDRLLGGLILFDVAILTSLLLVTGGPSNPFTISYLVYITLAAVTLDSSRGRSTRPR